MTRIAWITPGYPPDRGGVSDHTFAMVSELRARGHEVLVCSKPHESGFPHLTVEIAAFGPELIVVSYVPLAFAPRTGGIAPAFVLWCTQLHRRFAARTLLLAHETNLPAAAHWKRRELKLALLAAAQIAQFELLARIFDGVLFSNEAMRALWVKRLPRRAPHLQTVRICSNIPFVRASNPKAALGAAGYTVPRRTALFFGTGHESVLFDYVEAALLELSRVDPDVRLVIVGVDAAKVQRLSPALGAMGERVQALGFLPAPDVSLWLQAADLVLAPIAEGVSARKGTVMAAFHHGAAVVTTKGVHTLGDIDWAHICAMSAVEPRAFAALAAQCFRDDARRTALGAAAKSEYEAHASAAVTSERILAYGLGA